MNQDQDLCLIKRFRIEQDHFSREALVKKYLPMVRHIVKNHHVPISDFDDYFQEGVIGLLKAIDEYDPENYQIKFSTFAYICIIRRIFNTLKSAKVQTTYRTVKVLSLNAFVNNEDESCTLMDLLPNLHDEPFAEVEDSWMQQKLAAVLEAYLSPIELQVMQMVLNGYKMRDIQNRLSLSLKVLDNARTRARLKLTKILYRYGSLLSPQIPLKARKRTDLTIRFENHPA